MRTLLRWSSRLKWLGLLGLPMFLSEQPVWKWMWLFWLFGILEIALSFPIFLQSLRQLAGIVICSCKNRPMPDKDNFLPKITYSLPFEGAWTIVNGGVSREASHSWDINSQRYAYDFLILDDSGKSCRGNFSNCDSYYCYGRTVLSPADGVVEEIRTDCEDSKIFSGKTDPLIRDIRGNYVLLRHTDLNNTESSPADCGQEYSLLAHLMPGSIQVKKGQRVRRGEPIAHCGNSGNSTEPHLHFQVQNGKSFYHSAGLPIHFEHVNVGPQPGYESYDPRPVPAHQDDRFPHRGQKIRQREKVMNKNRPEIPLNCLFQACYNPKLEEEIRNCKEKCHQFNRLSPNDRDGQQKILEDLLGGMGENVVFTPPFWCDYGYHIFVGDFFYANHNLVITDGAEVRFGDHVFIAPNCCITTAEHAIDPEQRKAGMEVAKPVSIGNNVWIGAGSTILAGVTIGDNSVIGAGSVVTKDIPAGVVAFGVPCRVMREITDADRYRYPIYQPQ